MSSNIEDAIKNARYNEAVVITIDGEDSSKCRELVLVAAIDKITGGVSWQDAATQECSQNSDAIDIGISRHLRTKKWVFPMLNDTHRNNLYASSIKKACLAAEKINSSETGRNIRILDIGSGSGFLAMLAARSFKETSGKDPEIISIEMASAMARLARQTIASNNLGGSIEVIEGHSCDETFNPYADGNKAIICTSELLETGLLGEGIIPAMRDAWKRHLGSDAIVVPQKARVYAQVLEGKSCINSYRGPYNHNLGFCLSTNGHKALIDGVGGFRVPIHAEALFINDSSDFLIGHSATDKSQAGRARPLSEPVLVLEFDFTSKESIPSSSGRILEKDVYATNTGKAHGVLFWWELDLWKGETYSTESGKSPFQDHWQQCLYVFGVDDENCETLKEGEAFSLITSHDDTSISFSISTAVSSEHDEKSPKRQRLEQTQDDDGAFQNHISCYRALQLNDEYRMNILSSAIQVACDFKGKNAVVLDISDFSLCSIIAAKAAGATKVTSLESSSNGVPYLSALVAQIGNNLPCEGCKYQVVNAHAESLTLDILGGEVDVVLAEPYYEVLEGWHLQEALNYFYLLRSLKRRGIVKNDAISVPSHASIVACAVQLDESVARSHGCLQDSSLCGLSHEDVNKYWLAPSYDIQLPIFQYKWKRLSSDFTIANLQYDGSSKSMVINGDGDWSETVLKGGKCHGILIWVDYKVKMEDITQFATFTTGNHYHQQAFRMMKFPVVVKEGSSICVKPSFDIENTLEDHNIEIKIKLDL